MRARDDYLTGVLDALARNAATIQPRLDRAFFNRKRPIDIFAISDVHVDVPENARCVRERVDDILRRRVDDADDGRFRVVVVAGDAGTSERSVETCVEEFSRAFDCVCYLPAGNHELWCAGRGDDEEEENTDASTSSYPRDSLGKMWRLIDLCTALGAACAPIQIGGARVVPTYGWYDDAFASDPARRGVYSPLEARFDMACRWPTFINPPEDARNSRSPRIGDFMRDVNDGLYARFHHPRGDDDGATTTTDFDDDVVVTYSHFVPRPELYRGYSNLINVMGSTSIDAAARKWRASTHVFGHSHLNVDRVVDGVRYVQHALGYPHERWTSFSGASLEPKKIVSTASPSPAVSIRFPSECVID